MSSTSNTYKNFSGRKRRKRRTTFQDRKIAKIASQVYEQKEAAEVELKLHDQEFQSTVGISGVTHLLSGIAVGTGYNERVGAQVLGKSLLFRYQLTAADVSNIMRVIIFRWFDDTSPTPGMVLEVGPSSATINPLSPILYDNRDKIQILHDNLHSLNISAVYYNAGATVYPRPQVDKMYIKRNMKIRWQTDDTVDEGHIYALFVSDSTLVGHPAYHFYSRLRYTDA